MKKFITGMVAAAAALLTLAFTPFVNPIRHVAYSGASLNVNAQGFVIQYPSGSGTSPIIVATAWEAPVLQVSTGLGAGALLATGTVYGGFTTASSLVLKSATMYVSVASSNTAANQVITATDGTNTCTFIFACNSNTPSGTLSTGVASAGGSNGSGTGCSYAAGAYITISTTTQGCGTAATVKNIVISGIPNGV